MKKSGKRRCEEKKKAIKWTKEDFEKVCFDYERNIKRLIDAHDKGDKILHAKYVKEEARLDRREITIRKALGILASDPCPRNGYCSDCPTKERKNCIYVSAFRKYKKSTPSKKSLDNKSNIT